MTGVIAKRPRQIPNLYWQQYQPIGALVSNFRQIRYLPFTNAVPDLDQTLAGPMVVGGRNLYKQLIDFGEAAKVWLTVKVEYEPVNPLAKKQSYE